MPDKQEPRRPEKVNRRAFDETERETVTRAEVETAVRQVMKHPAKPEKQSENREPTREELNRRWKMMRRR